MTGSLRVAMLAPFAIHGPKGTTRWRVMPLARALAAEGHSVRVVVPPYDQPLASGSRFMDGGVEVVNVRLPRGAAQIGALSLASSLVRAVVDWQPDVVHSFKPKGYSGLAAQWLACRGYPLVQDSDDWEAGWNQLAAYPYVWRRLFAWQERQGLGRAAAVTVASRWLERLATRLRQGSAGVFYLPNGVDAAAYELSLRGGRRRSNLASAERDCFAEPRNDTPGVHSQGASRPEPWETRSDMGSHSRQPMPADFQPAGGAEKRVLLYTRFVETSPAAVWRVWAAVLARYPQARLVVVGAGGAGEERALLGLAAAAGRLHSVVALGWQPAETLPGLLAAVDAAMFPVADTPLNRAKSPMRLLDALAAGAPVATQAVGEYAGYVADGETGLLAPAGDAGALSDAVIRLLADCRLARRLGHEAARRMAIDHAWPRLAQTALAAYEFALTA